MRVVTLGGLGDVKETGEGIVGPDMSFTLEEADAAAAGEASSSSWITTLSPAAVWGMRIGLYGSIIGMTAVVAAAARKAF